MAIYINAIPNLTVKFPVSLQNAAETLPMGPMFYPLPRFDLRRLERVFTGGLVPSKCNPTRDPHATVRGFQRASDASCKQQWRPQLK